jgi:hypothetical protein
MTFEAVSVIGFKDSQADVEHLTLRDHDDVEPGRDLVSTENLAYQSLGSVSSNGPSKLSSDRDSQPSHAELVGQGEHGRVSAAEPGALIVHVLELGSPPDPLGATESSQITRC